MRTRLTGLFLVTAGLAVAGPDGACAISQTNILSPLTKITSGVPFTIPITTTGCTAPLRSVRIATGTLPIGAELYSSPTGAEISGKVYSPGVYVVTLRAVDAAYKLPTESVILQVNDGLRIDTPAVASGLPGSAYSDTIRARGGVAPYTFSIVEGALPTGLGLNASSGAITGNMPAAGSRFRIRVTDSSSPANTSEQPYTITTTGLVTTLTMPPAGSIGTPYNFDIDGSLGAAGFSIAIGSLPAGLTINTNGLISGTPSASGEFHFTVRQTAGLTSAWRSYRLLVNDAATIASAPRDAEEGAPYNHVFTTSGSVGPYTYAVTAGALPTGISLSSSTGALTGALPISGSGSAFTITATDASGRTHNQAFSIAAVTRLTGSTATPPTIRMTQTGTATPYILGGGGAGKEFNLIGGIGSQQVFINPFSGNTSYSFSTPGTYTPIVLGSDSLGGAVLFNTVNYRAVGPLAIDPAVELPNGKIGVSYSATVPVLNGDFGPLTFTVTAGTLPMNFTIGTSTGLISGAGDPMDGGQTYSFTVTVTDSAGQSAARAYFIGIASGAGVITTNSIPKATLTQSYSATVSQTGSLNPVFTNPGGGMPPGLTLSSAGLISGTPNTADTYTFLVRMQDSVTGATDTRQFTVNAATTPSFTMATASPNEATVDTSLFIGVTPSGGRSPYTLSLLSGSLPEGLFFQNFGSSIGISGFPLIAANQTFTILLTDADGRTASAAYTINIRQGVRITTLSGSLPIMTTGVPYSTTIGATLGSAPYTFSLGSGTLPAGLSLSSAGVLSGTPTATDTASFSILATDSFGRNGESSFNITPGTPISIGNAVPLPNGVVLSSYSVGLNTGLEANSTRIVSGDLPPLLYVSPSSGMIVGAPTLPGVYTFTVQVDDGEGRLATQAQQITVLGGLSFTPATVPNGVLSSPYSVTFVPVNASGSVTWSIVAGSLPAGLTLNPTSGVLSGTPNATGPFSFTVQAVDAALVPVTQNYTMQVANFLTINPATVPNGTVGASYSQVLTASGGSGGSSWGITAGALPGGLTLGPSNGILSGTPTTAGTFNFTVTATDSFSQTGSRAYTVTIASVLSITPASLPNGTVSTAYNQQLTATGGTGAIGWAVTAGALPGGLTLGPTSGAITGTPSAAGSFNFTVTATDSLNQTGSRVYSMTVLNTLSITPASLPNGTISTAYNQQLTATGGTGAIGWAVTAGALPGGLTLGPTSGAITGTPTAAGTFNFTVTATDSLTQTGSRVYSMTVLSVLSITPASLPNGAVSTAYSQQLTATGATGAIGWTVTSGALPGGLTLSPTTGAITGTPTAAGAFSFTVTATDSLTQAGSQAYSLTIANVLTIGPATLPNGTISTAYTQQLTATGGTGAVGWSITAGALPGGLILGPTSGAITGTPTAAGAFTFTVTATDSQSQTGARSYSLLILNVLTIAPNTLPNGTAGSAYNQQLTATPSTTSITWAVSAGTLPTGLTLNPQTGQLTGTPTAPGQFTFTATATDALNQTGSRAYTVTILAVLSLSPASVPVVYTGVPYSQAFTATGGTGAITWSIGSAPLPPGLTLNPATGIVSGTTSATTGLFTVTIQATDTLSQTGSRSYDFLVRPPVTITPATLPDATQGIAYSQSLTANGALGTATFQLSAGALPAGLTLATNGAISGTPTAIGTATFDVTVTTTQQQSATRTLTLSVLDPLAIATAALPDGTEFEAYTTTLAATGGTASGLTWSIQTGSTLPPGLALSNAGILAGTPTVHGTYTFTVQVANATGTRVAKPLTLVVVEALSITSLSLGETVQGRSYTTTLTAVGGRAPYTWALVNSSLPAGLQLNPATGLITGTTNVAEGTFPQNVVVTDSRGRVARRTLPFAVTVPPPPSLNISPTSIANGRVNQPYSAGFSASGGTPGYSFAIVQGAPPTGLALNGTTLSGTPTQEGTFRFTVNATDSQGRVAGNQYTVVIEAALVPLVVTPSSIAPTTQVGQPLTLQFGATGGKAPYTFSITGNTPPGTSSNSSGVLSGTPSQGGTFSFNVQVTDSLGDKASRGYSLSVTGNLVITTQSPLAEGTVGKPYSLSFGATGGKQPYTWSIAGTPPPGLAFNNGDLTGTPTTAGTFPFSVTVQDTQQLTASASFSITVWDMVQITNTPADTPLITGQPFNFTYATRGGKPPVTLALTGGALPAGLTFANGVITGTPTGPGNFAFTVQATDGLGNTAAQSSALRVVAPLTVTTANLPSGTVGTAYSAALTATGGVAPLGAWSLSQGTLPAGLALAPDGAITGIPTAAGTSTFTVRITDAANTAATRQLTISIQLPPVPGLIIPGLPQFLTPGTQTNITIQLAQPFPVPVTGTLTLIFEPNAVNNADDPSVQFSSGGRTVTFVIPAGQTAGTFPVTPLRLISGTVAGTIRIRITTSPESATPVPDAIVPITRSAPVITAGTAQLSATSFTLLIDGFSNTREIVSATFRLTPAPGSSLATTDVPVSVAATFAAYYQSAASVPFGGQFRLTQPFNVNGPLTDIDSVVVTVTNSVGTSQPFTIRLR